MKWLETQGSRISRWRHRISIISSVLATGRHDPACARQMLQNLPAVCRARRLGQAWDALSTGAEQTPADNSLWEYFANHTDGHGIFKWHHYFEAYHRHFTRITQRPVHVVEIGVLGGGSLDMWAHHFGAQSYIYGIDIRPESMQFERDNIRIFIGDQQDRRFWTTFKEQVPQVDVVIDDGGHRPEQQMVTLEEMLPHLRSGGVYICEDVHGIHNAFAAYATGLVCQLNQLRRVQGQRNSSALSPFQQAVHSIHFYPYLMVIEIHSTPPMVLRSSRRGTEWPR